MVDDLDSEDEISSDLFDRLAAAFGMLGTLSAGNPVAAGVAGVLGSAMTIAGMLTEEEDEEPITGDINTIIGSMAEKTKNGIVKTLSLAMGEEEDESLYEYLPAMRDDSLHSNVAKFFNGGWWLVEPSASEIHDTVAEAVLMFRRRVADAVVQLSGHVLAVDMFDEPATECYENYILMDYDGVQRCVQLVKYPTFEGWTPITAEYIGNMEKYGLDALLPYYETIVDCHLHGGDDKKVDKNYI